MNIILFDTPKSRNALKPLTLTRPVGSLRLGVFTISEKWEAYFSKPVSFLSEDYLAKKFPANYLETNLYINAAILPDFSLVEAINKLKISECLYFDDTCLAYFSDEDLQFGFEPNQTNRINYSSEITSLKGLPSLFINNALEISKDLNFISHNKVSKRINDKGTVIYNEDNVFIEENVNIKAAILNAEAGPIYIGKNAIIQEGSIIIGPVSIGQNAMVAFGAKIRPNTSIGPSCRVGGEVGNSIFYGNSNKAHDGFLGNSYIGEWCNLGANTNNSNLKNDYKSVKLHDYESGELINTGETFCGTFMGDYTKAGISTMFNTGTVVGVCANVYGEGFQEKYIPSFSWGGKADGYQTYRFEKAIEVINATLSRRDKLLTEEEIEILKYISTHS